MEHKDPYNEDSIDKLDNSSSMGDFVQKAKSAKLPSTARSKDEMWQDLTSRFDTSPDNTLPIWTLGIAASIALLIAFFFVSRPKDYKASYVAEASTTQDITLPDSSTIALNAGSSADIFYTQDLRKISLRGEAFFEVEKGEEFKVVTSLGTITVLGTSFNVSQREGVLEVSCKTGKVSVETETNKWVLTPSQSVLIENDTAMQRVIDLTQIGTWQSGEFYYDNRPVAEVMQEIERQFGVNVSSEIADSRKFSGYFFNSDLETALTMICAPLDLSFVIENDQKVTIQSN